MPSTHKIYCAQCKKDMTSSGVGKILIQSPTSKVSHFFKYEGKYLCNQCTITHELEYIEEIPLRDLTKYANQKWIADISHTYYLDRLRKKNTTPPDPQSWGVMNWEAMGYREGWVIREYHENNNPNNNRHGQTS